MCHLPAMPLSFGYKVESHVTTVTILPMVYFNNPLVAVTLTRTTFLHSESSPKGS